MKTFWRIFEKLDDGAHIVSEASNTLTKASFSILISTGLISIVGAVGLIGFSIWEGRKELAELAFNVLVSGLEDSPKLGYEWDRIPIEEWPEGWICNRNSMSCKPDLEKREQVLAILHTLKSKFDSPRVVYSVYGTQYRRIAAQVTGVGERSLPEDLWVIRLSDDGYSANVKRHFQGLCNNIVIAELPETSRLRMEAPLFNREQLVSCPVNKLDTIYKAKGYISVDLEKAEVNLESIKEIEEEIKIAAEAVEKIMGYDLEE